MDISTISDVDLEKEYYKRKSQREAIAAENHRKERLRFTKLVVDKIHEIDRTIPIIIYDRKKHANWKFKRSDGDSRFDIKVTPHEFGYMKRYKLCPNMSISREEWVPILAEKFIEWIWKRDRYCGKMPNKKDNFYFISKFDVGEFSRDGGDFSLGGYVLYNYEKRSNLIKEDK